jgi:hypothetical protein
VFESLDEFKIRIDPAIARIKHKQQMIKNNKLRIIIKMLLDFKKPPNFPLQLK